MLFTRTITTFEATAVDVVLDPNTLETRAEPIATVHYDATAASKTEARKAFAEQGYTIPKGTEIVQKPVKETRYACSLEDFLEIAQPIEVKDGADE